MMPRSTPTHCDDCGRAIDPPRTYWAHIGTPTTTPYCADCSRWHAESFTPAACLLQAQMIIRQHQQRTTVQR